ncbi:MAG: hypothetical protein ACRDLN_16610, partial [Solirubrobacteraceae bacterium]
MVVDRVVADDLQRRVGSRRGGCDAVRLTGADGRVALAREDEHAGAGRDHRQVDRGHRHREVAQLATRVDAEDRGRRGQPAGRRHGRVV